MYLKTLTLRGFKSFASATTLNFEPGITCVVGPNGSGKSNVVDALAWVMGEQGAKTLRGGNMADVIFAGTSSRPPLGRAEVSLTIDNSDGTLPIDYTEVTISRTLFRNGGSEYAINGTPCRLLDIQELLSDTGMGREMHVIVGQGQLDTILSASPEDRRAFIEEAAGVLKHRRRKEKALRKLDSMEANLARLNDLVGEIRRQLGPLARQAEVARRAHVVQSDLRDAKARLLADELVQMLANLEAEKADEAALRERRAAVEQAQRQARAQLTELEAAAAEAAPAVNEASEMWFRLSSVRERLRGTESLAAERVRLLGTPEAHEHGGRDPEDLDQQAASAREVETQLRKEQTQAAERLAALIAERKGLEAAAAEAEKALTAVHRGLADRREGLAKLTGSVSAKRSRLEATEAEIERLRAAHTAALARANSAQEEYRGLEQQVAWVESGEDELKARHEASLVALDAAEVQVAALLEQQRSAQTDLTAWRARQDALDLTLTRKDATGALISSRAPGILGSVAGEIQVRPGYETAIAAALGHWAEAAVAESIEAAADALRSSRETEAGIANMLIAEGGVPPESFEARPPVGHWARDLLTMTPRIAPAIDRMLAGVVVTATLAQAREAAEAGLTGVSEDGDVVAPTYARGGSGGGPSALELHAAREEAEAKVHESTKALEAAQQALAPAQEQLQLAQNEADAALAAVNESGSALAEVSRKLAELGATARSSTNEAARAEEAIELAQAAREVIAEELAELSNRLQAEQQTPDEDTGLLEATEARDEAAQAASRARGEETDARLALRTLEERMRAITGRAESLERAARAERRAREEARKRAERRARQSRQARTVAQGAARVLAAIETSLTRAGRLRDELQALRTQRDEQISRVRTELDDLARQYAELTDVVHKDEVARASAVAKIEQLQSRSIDELGIDPEILVEEYGPHQMITLVDDEETAQVPFVRAEQEKRLRKAERALALLGRVNPLALEEHKALEERHKFLADQLADIHSARTELLGIVKDIDERVEVVFAEAFADTAREFEGVFAKLFPGGQGRLTLTDPTDMLTTGIEVEARPPGKKVKRLSLLSGGERSLTAVAILIAIFKARPSPFYVMDEVEAALDDVNLGRLIELFAELRMSSQLIVITHQKRTMEIADALYGVTMRGDGVTTVISQRMAEAGA